MDSIKYVVYVVQADTNEFKEIVVRATNTKEAKKKVEAMNIQYRTTTVFPAKHLPGYNIYS